jgi:hypothetical protein
MASENTDCETHELRAHNERTVIDMRRTGALAPAVVAGLAGLCCALLLLAGMRQRTVLMASAAPDARQVAAGITRELFGSARHQQLLRVMGTVRPAAAAPRAFPVRAGTMLDDEEEPMAAAGDLQDDEYARFVWRKERLEREGVNVDTWMDPGLLDGIDFRDRPYTAGHHPADENITNTTTQFFAHGWPQLNETTNATWIDDEDFRWNSPADYLGKRPLEVDHHHVVDHHLVKFLPGVNINSNPFCGQNLDGSPIDCGDSEWNVR